MDYKIAKSFIESLIFSAEEPLTKESMTKILSYYGDFNLDLILICLFVEILNLCLKLFFKVDFLLKFIYNSQVVDTNKPINFLKKYCVKKLFHDQ